MGPSVLRNELITPFIGRISDPLARHTAKGCRVWGSRGFGTVSVGNGSTPLATDDSGTRPTHLYCALAGQWVVLATKHTRIRIASVKRSPSILMLVPARVTPPIKK